MELAKRLTINAFFIMAAKGLQPIISFIMILAIGRKLGVIAFGIYSTAISYILIFQIIASFGLRTLITREVAKYRDQVQSYIVNSLYLAVPLSIITGIVMCLFVVYVMKLDLVTAKITCLLGISLLATAIVECFEGALAGYEKIQTISYIYIVENIFKVGLCVLFILLGYGLMAIIIIHVLARYVAVMLYFPSILKLMKHSNLRPDWMFAKKLFKTAYIFAIIMILVTMYWNIDIVFLNKIHGNEEAGIYSGAKRFVLFLVTLIQSFFTAFFPVISGLYESRSESFQQTCKKSLQYLMIAVVPLTVLITLLADKIFYLTFGARFEQSIGVLRILVWILIPYSISQVFAYALLASNNQKIDLRVNAISLTCNCVLSSILISSYAYIGAAIAALISIFIYVGLQVPFVFKNVIQFDFNKLGALSAKLMVSGIVMISTILLLNKFNLIGLILLSMLIYFMLLYLFKTFSTDDINFIKSFLRKRTA